MFGFGFPELIILFAILFVVFFIPVWTANVAKNKGRNWLVWLIIGFILNIIGLIIAYIIPVQVGGKYGKCPKCAEPVLKEAMVCKHCGAELVQGSPTLSKATS